MDTTILRDIKLGCVPKDILKLRASTLKKHSLLWSESSLYVPSSSLPHSSCSTSYMSTAKPPSSMATPTFKCTSDSHLDLSMPSICTSFSCSTNHFTA